jgi:hypothetical protein
MADRAEQQVPVLAPQERWVEAVFAAQPARELQAWRQQAARPELELAMPVVSRQEPALAVPREQRKPEGRELARPALAPRQAELLVSLQQELVEQAQERAAWRQPLVAERQVVAEQRALQLLWRLFRLQRQLRPQHPLQPVPEWCGVLSPRRPQGWSSSAFSFP